ncbi:MAG: alanine--tRNA ligase [Candidatus Lambdaproteobacteria bacterium RIFOXYD2_FULL_50_16]|uniref:Alanine--tRNA ligase n=1 Tax=Candidatus Lambdaproteobacteria bacterium RIFOXYD2_FULL_50_16 TaxID=1817772 RepID=A0A1F6GD77_9PROT|nr:MAG: alanine--tRNA ligase [Candidatus Lambdaproteobacteria bacterium RIFOXYD2_FULL_50_16]
MTGNQIREAFVQYFKTRGHKEVRSSSLVPLNDPTILFTNAGMNQFKDYFLGNQEPAYKCAVTSQKVMRAGGKHNDLENVGRTDRHHTFFEMLGNFSFGDYFKKEAINYAWEFLTVTLGLDPNQLAVSVYKDDQEAYDLWANQVGIPPERIARLGEKDNFWAMGDTGPCGPCTEIHYRLHPLKEGRNPKESLEADDGSHLEVWNLVFMQYNRDETGKLNPLPAPCVDTGMGLERIVSVVQGKQTNYDTDLLHPLCAEIAHGAGYKLGQDSEGDVHCRVIADHIRACVFLIADGVIPSNEGRGYVLRRIIRRAARHGKELGYQPGFFAGLTDFLVAQMAQAYPELGESADYVKILLTQEERRFDSTLTQGLKIIGELIEGLEKQGQKTAPGEAVFKLYDTYGFPADLAGDILEDKGLAYDPTGFEKAMNEQRQRAKAAQGDRSGELKVDEAYVALSKAGHLRTWVGYDQLQPKTQIQALIKAGSPADTFTEGEEVEVLLAESPFYAEGGGQVGDQGELIGETFRIKVTDTKAPLPGLNMVKGKVVSGALKSGDSKRVLAQVDEVRRRKIECNHTATHLLQGAMRQVLGDHVKQAGSQVNEEKLRFDFSHYAPMSPEELADVEALVNQQIRANAPVNWQVMDFDQAMKTGAMAIFGEKYGDEVRVVTAGSSKEFCGGCHTSATGNIGLLKIVSEQAISSGVRRIEAVTGEAAYQWTMNHQQGLERLAKRLKVGLEQASERIEQVLEQAKEKEKEFETLAKRLAAFEAEQALEGIRQINGVSLLVMASSEKDLKAQASLLLKEMQGGVVMLSSIEGDKVSVLIAVAPELTGRFSAGAIIAELSPLVSGRGGGKPGMAQLGGTNPAGLKSFEAALEAKLAAG